MKKPNITEGEWEVMPRVAGLMTKEIVCRTDFHFVTTELTYSDRDTSLANATLMSASKDMMEELIEQYRMLMALETEGLPPSLQNGGYKRHIEGIEQALTKAGVEL